jgi:hypothetical protein
LISREADALITAVIKKNDNIHIYVPDSQKIYSAEKTIKEGNWMFFFFTTTAVSTPHINVDQSTRYCC